MAKEWSENYKYNNPDIGGLVDNVKRMMGVDSGAAGRRSRNMSDFLTGAKTEGQQLKNIMLGNKNQAFTQGINDPTLQKMFGKILGTLLSNPGSASSLATAYGTGQNYQGKLDEQAAKVLAQQQIAKQEEQKAGIGGLREGLAKQIAAMGLPVNIGDYDRSNPNEMRGYSNALDKQRIDSETLEALAQRFGVLGDKPHTTTTDVAGSKGERITTSKVNLFEARTTAAKNLGVANVELANKRTSEVIERMGLAGKLNAEKIKEIQDRVLINWNQGFQKAKTAKKRRELLEQEIKTEIQKTLGAKETVKKKVAETSIAEKEADFKGGELYRLERKQWEELEKLKLQVKKEKNLVKKAELSAELAEKTQQHKITKAKAEKEEAESQALTAKSKQEMTSMDLAGYKEKLKNLKDQREDLLAKGKILLENAKTDKERKQLGLEIQKELRPLEKEIKELAIEMADVNIRSKSRESLTKTPSPSEEERAKQLKLEQIKAKKRSNSGSGTGTTTEELIKARMGVTNGEGTSTTGGLPVPVSKKGMPPDPEAKAIFDDLMSTVDPAVLKSWTPEEIDSAVILVKQNFPNMDEGRIRNLIKTAQRRSQ